MKIYTVWSDDGNCYFARTPEYPSVSAFGDTPEEAKEILEIALEYIKDDL